jgi:phosphoribosylformimino-5-aminoimidazole carboxamide ribotide isomerase
VLIYQQASAQRQEAFELLAAIDLVGGQVVRLRQGDFRQATVYATGPSVIAKAFADAGARWLHVVDLDGARHGAPAQLEIVRQIVEAVAGRARVELGGGLRTTGAVEAAIGAGATRVAVGTAALRDSGFAAGLVQRYGAHRIAVSIDVRDGLALGEGWRAGAPGLPAADAIRTLAALGVHTFEVTAIDRDGMLGGPDLLTLGALADLRVGRIIASGGIATVDDVLAVRAIGCAGAIVGKALYEGHIRLPDLVAALG